VSFQGLSIQTLFEPVPLGIFLGLLLGKQLGVFTAASLAIRAGWAELPHHASWGQLYGVALLCGVGFTMSLFIGMLAFPDMLLLQSTVKIGVLAGSIVSALIGAFVLIVRRSQRHQPSHHSH
jgi:NhaA family Na+:H+ antiporter